MFKIVPISVYNSDIVVCIDTDEKQLYRKFSHLFDDREQFNEVFNFSVSTTARTIQAPSGFIIIILKDLDDIGIIAHESLHATSYILSHRGIYFSEETEEVYSYLLAYIVNKIVKLKKQSTNKI